MTGRTWFYIGSVAVGAIGGALYMKHRHQLKPIAAGLLAKSMCLKDKALDYTAMIKEQAEDIVAEAKHINETKTQADA